MNNSGVYVRASSINVINNIGRGGRESRYANIDGAKRNLMVVVKTCQSNCTFCDSMPSHCLKTMVYLPISDPTEAPSPWANQYQHLLRCVLRNLMERTSGNIGVYHARLGRRSPSPQSQISCRKTYRRTAGQEKALQAVPPRSSSYSSQPSLARPLFSFFPTTTFLQPASQSNVPGSPVLHTSSVIKPVMATRRLPEALDG